MDDAATVAQISARDFAEVRKAVEALDYLGFDMTDEKATFNTLRRFLADVAGAATFRADKLDVKQVLREASEPDPARVRAVGDRIVGVHLRELRDSLAEHGDEAVAEIDRRRDALRDRYNELRPVAAHLSAEDAIGTGLVDEYREYKSLLGAWKAVQSAERALLNVRAIPSEGGAHAKLSHRQWRIGHLAWARKTGRIELDIEDGSGRELYEAAAQSTVTEPEVSGQFDPFDTRNTGGGIPGPQAAPEKVVLGHNL
ncbi:hypothetical protein FK530_18955 [Tsukamurella conjunctivitidis]|uniref:Uncharacterized protein n=1 Tax=Tsukamurella conjunctivitidis TaxID=2592068 RepID=A0A5C5RXA9_9ACTN|nr:hypothetical protein [Tsukamurella conjunctivitidis]TWS27402.1 hypothetical protein FK530_18955 [Tsukamurella conjunctivitidis]